MDQNHVITIDQEVELMLAQMKQPPKLLLKLAGNTSCCIFRVPQSQVELNQEAYRPRIVSIGPYHYGGKDLEMIQEHKWRYLNDFIVRTGKPLKFFMDIIVSMEVQIRRSYSESTDHFRTNELAKMMVLDGVFLIELFQKVGKLAPVHPDDPIFRMLWMSPILMTDLLKIENQIPYFVLKKLFSESNTVESTLTPLILKFFNYLVNRKAKVLEENGNLDGKHILDLFRKSFIYPKNRGFVRRSDNGPIKLIQPATKLAMAGVKFKANYQAESFLDVEFKNGYIYIPQTFMESFEFYSLFISNCVAFEQCYYDCSKEITAYAVFMECLIYNSKDARLVSGILSYFDIDEEIVKFFNHIGKGVAFNINENYLEGLHQDVNDYCKNEWHGVWAGFTHTYFQSPWAFISAFAAFILLSLAAIQTFYTVYPYYHKD